MAITKPPLTPADQVEIIHNLCKKLQAFHVFPEIAGQQCEILKSKLATGKYSGIDGGRTFARTLTEDLWSVIEDEHLWVRWSETPLPEDAGSLRQNPGRSGGQPGHREQLAGRWREAGCVCTGRGGAGGVPPAGARGVGAG